MGHRELGETGKTDNWSAGIEPCVGHWGLRSSSIVISLAMRRPSASKAKNNKIVANG